MQFPALIRTSFYCVKSHKTMRSFFWVSIGDWELRMPNTSALLVQSRCRHWGSAAGYFARAVERWIGGYRATETGASIGTALTPLPWTPALSWVFFANEGRLVKWTWPVQPPFTFVGVQKHQQLQHSSEGLFCCGHHLSARNEIEVNKQPHTIRSFLAFHQRRQKLPRNLGTRDFEY